MKAVNDLTSEPTPPAAMSSTAKEGKKPKTKRWVNKAKYCWRTDIPTGDSVG